MKVLFLNHDESERTGAGRFLHSLEHELLRSSGMEFVHLIYGSRIFPKKIFLLVYWIFGFGKKLEELVSSCEIIHALDGWPYGFWAALLAKKYNKKLIITAVGTGGVKPLYGFFTRILLAWAYRKADKLVAVSHHTKNEILKILPDLKIEVINHGVDAEKFQSIAVGNQTLIPKPYILSVGAWKRRKGLENSIKVFDSLKLKFPDLRYVILSKPSEEIRKKYNQVSFVSGILEEDLISLYKNAELFILLPQDDSKDIEGFGLVYLEAAAAGIPVIGSRGSSAEDAILDGKNGFLVDSLETGSIIEKIGLILTDSHLRDRMSRASLDFAKSMTWSKVAASYIEIYNND